MRPIFPCSILDAGTWVVKKTCATEADIPRMDPLSLASLALTAITIMSGVTSAATRINGILKNFKESDRRVEKLHNDLQGWPQLLGKLPGLLMNCGLPDRDVRVQLRICMDDTNDLVQEGASLIDRQEREGYLNGRAFGKFRDDLRSQRERLLIWMGMVQL